MTEHPELRIAGTPASAGVALGPAVVIEHQEVTVVDSADPKAAFTAAVAEASGELQAMCDAARSAGRAEAGDVLEAQALMARDPMLVDAVNTALADGLSLDAALARVEAEISSLFASIDDPYMAQRAQDVGEVIDWIRRCLTGVDSAASPRVESPSVLVARSVTAADTAVLDPELVLGFVTETGGPTSHVAIIARSLGVAAVVAASGVVESVSTGEEVALDGSTGDVAIRPSETTAADFEARRAVVEAEVAAAERFRGIGVSFRGRPIQVSANVGSHADVARALEARAEGIGLLRTEFLFLDRTEAPSEQEQVGFYSFAGSSFSEPVVVRTFDIGGDKPAPYLELEAEENPFLGVRGARLYSRCPDVFDTQVRAILQAACTGDVQMMLPMVSTVEEVLDLRGRVEQTAERLEAEGVPHAVPPVGIMVEVPSVALTADALAPHVDFFSIGTNDLTQYAMAADRTNGSLDHLQDALHPAVLALCERTVAAARRHNISVSVCGLAAADPLGAAVLTAMGVDKLSVSARFVNLVKSVIDSVDRAEAGPMVEAALSAAAATDVRRIVREALDRA
ncbi:MAG: phosphoenolpyruvate--protein phosphotransferase [Acidimicrobiia bacterium]|nr:phosphoenolpyruvate--protein phosphotransferase [Acidimicrobiia bacterium]